MSVDKTGQLQEASALPKAALVMRDEGLVLVCGNVELLPDLSHMAARVRPDRLHRELLVRAAKLRNVDGEPFVVDATAGLGEDSLLLAAAGFRVRMYEHEPTIAALLRDALERARKDERLADAVSRMDLVEADSVEALRNLELVPDVVYLDPMFPQRKKSAAVKKKLQLLQTLERPCSNEDELLSAALAVGPRKVVVKRPVKGPYLAGVKPSHSLAGKAVRYDVLLP